MMFGTRTRKIWRDITSRKLRTLLVSFSIFIGVLGVVSLISASNILVDRLEKDIQEDRLAMMRIFLAPQRSDIDNDEMLDTIRDQEGVTHAEARSINTIIWRKAGAEDFDEGSYIVHSEDLADTYIEPTRLVEGRYPEAKNDSDSPIEVAVEQRFADRYDVAIGDELEIRVLRLTADDAAPQPSTQSIEVARATVVGILLQPYTIPATLDVGAPDTQIYLRFEDAQQVLSINAYTVLLVRYEQFQAADDALESVEATIRQETGYIPVNASTADPAENDQIEQTRSTGQILVVLAVIALVVSGFLIINVISAIVSEQRKQIGIMKSLGATRLDAFFIYSGISIVYGLLGAIPGVLLGIPGGYFAAKGLGNVFNTVIEDFEIIPVAIGIGLVLGLAIPFLASILPVVLGTRLSILDALSDRGIGARFGRGFFERLLSNLPLPLSLRQSVNSAFQKKGRLALTGLTLTLASAAFMGIFSVFFALSQLVATTFNTYGYQLAIDPGQRQDYENVRTILTDNVEGIEAIEPSVQLSIGIEGFEAPPVTAGPPGINATGFNTENPDVLNLDLVEGDGWENDSQRDGVVVSTRIRDYTGLGDGDQITITAGGNSQTFDIIGVARWPFNDVWFKWQDLAEFGGFVDENTSVPYANVYNVILENDELTSDGVDEKGDEIKEVLLNNNIIAEPSNLIAFAETITQIVVIFGIVLSLAALLIAAVGGVGLLTTLSISVFERQKEIGVMRSVGATSSKVALQFLIEGLVVGFAAWLVAIPISLLIRQQLLNNLPFGDIFQIDYPPLTLLIGLVGMLALVAVASLWPSFSAARKTVSEILRYQ